MLLSVIIPCYNEEKTIDQTIGKILNQENIKEIIIIDDNSTDNSINIINKIVSNKIIIIKNIKNFGKGHCVIEGIKKASGEIILIQDADSEYNPKDISVVLNPFLEFNADFVIGTRFQTRTFRKIGYFYHTIFNKLITFLVNFKTNKNFTDVECGYKAIRKSIIQGINLKEKDFTIEIELILKLCKLKINIFEVAVSYNMRTYEEGKKIRLKDAFLAILTLLKY
jgi:glycosyltransferase involved in cell wall biosynthesis